MNESQFNDLHGVLIRIAKALEEGSGDGTEHLEPDQMERMLAVQERQVKVQEERLEVDRMHNEMHLRGEAHKA